MHTFIGGLLFLEATSGFGQILYQLDPTNFHTGNDAQGTCPTGTGTGPCTQLYQNTNHFDLYFNTNGNSKMVGTKCS